MAKQRSFGHRAMNQVLPKLRNLHSPDTFDLRSAKFDSNQPFSVLVQAMFSPGDAEGEESFDFVVCNPSWLAREAGTRVLSGRHLLIQNTFDIGKIEEYLVFMASKCTADSWDEAAKKLARIGKWEFEDYVEPS
jgi:Immunity protein 8